MNQEKFDETEDGTRRIINGPRPSPLKIKKESHVIRKPSNSSTVQFMAPPLKKQNGPVIIYTESPKIIHAEARDFMALVQKLTGHSRSSAANEKAETVDQSEKKDNQILTCEENENDESFSVEMDKNKSSSSSSPIYKFSNPYLADFPLFTPNSTNLFCSPQQNMGSSLSPTLMNYLKGISEY
ncbi:PREDICTED: VQ motif-containing protein 8, chloroplastic-like [Nicotiana attenuata]|uniref:Vq motif-containing protein 8, chloroplastic n=1 Tax=Nicotiana attenuata TaxID=49451 RepID=A0A1J6J704_NICAT|nr:PREDICTED: VQ motif-containing protein 8, chloroplastic-like [Nicotiana attenuata]OIT08424.1 vq motif-containing protein 8, chloroplastic [Nicotiana attenuata]